MTIKEKKYFDKNLNIPSISRFVEEIFFLMIEKKCLELILFFYIVNQAIGSLYSHFEPYIQDGSIFSFL